MFEAARNSVRWGWVKSEWDAGNYLKSIVVFGDSLPNLTYPGGPGEMDRLFDQYKFWKFTGPMAGVTWWRELWHFIGGFSVTLPFFYFQSFCFWMPLIIMTWHSVIEFLWDAKRAPDLKNFIDVWFWVLGSASVTVLSFFLFGPANYK